MTSLTHAGRTCITIDISVRLSDFGCASFVPSARDRNRLVDRGRVVVLERSDMSKLQHSHDCVAGSDGPLNATSVLELEPLSIHHHIPTPERGPNRLLVGERKHSSASGLSEASARVIKPPGLLLMILMSLMRRLKRPLLRLTRGTSLFLSGRLRPLSRILGPLCPSPIVVFPVSRNYPVWSIWFYPVNLRRSSLRLSLLFCRQLW